jgi:hypothetical protein
MTEVVLLSNQDEVYHSPNEIKCLRIFTHLGQTLLLCKANI